MSRTYRLDAQLAYLATTLESHTPFVVNQRTTTPYEVTKVVEEENPRSSRLLLLEDK